MKLNEVILEMNRLENEKQSQLLFFLLTHSDNELYQIDEGFGDWIKKIKATGSDLLDTVKNKFKNVVNIVSADIHTVDKTVVSNPLIAKFTETFKDLKDKDKINNKMDHIFKMIEQHILGDDELKKNENFLEFEEKFNKIKTDYNTESKKFAPVKPENTDELIKTVETLQTSLKDLPLTEASIDNILGLTGVIAWFVSNTVLGVVGVAAIATVGPLLLLAASKFVLIVSLLLWFDVVEKVTRFLF